MKSLRAKKSKPKLIKKRGNTIPFSCPRCGNWVNGKDLSGFPCKDCKKDPSCHQCCWPD